jgi:PAS domain S-box-containing protein
MAVNSAWVKATTSGNPFLSLGPGSNYLELCQDLSKCGDPNHALVAVSIVAALQGRIRRIKLEYPVTDQGRISWFGMTATSPEEETTAEFGAVIAHQDITERMDWETRVRRNENLFKATTENALDLIAIMAADGRTVYTSPSYGKTLGYGVPVMAKSKLLDLVCEQDQPGFRENCRIGLSSGISPLFEYGVRHRNGQFRQMEARAVAVDNPGGERDSILLISRDISAKKEAEQERGRTDGREPERNLAEHRGGGPRRMEIRSGGGDRPGPESSAGILFAGGNEPGPAQSHRQRSPCHR